MDIQELEDLTRELNEAKSEYEEASKISKGLYATLEEKKQKYISVLEELDRSSFEAEGIARVTKIESLCVTTPKDVESKKKLFKWIKENMGDNGFWSYVNINSQSLNSLFKQTMEETLDPILNEKMGLSAPTVRKTLRVNKR